MLAKFSWCDQYCSQNLLHLNWAQSAAWRENIKNFLLQLSNIPNSNQNWITFARRENLRPSVNAGGSWNWYWDWLAPTHWRSFPPRVLITPLRLLTVAHPLSLLQQVAFIIIITVIIITSLMLSNVRNNIYAHHQQQSGWYVSVRIVQAAASFQEKHREYIKVSGNKGIVQFQGERNSNTVLGTSYFSGHPNLLTYTYLLHILYNGGAFLKLDPLCIIWQNQKSSYFIQLSGPESLR